MAFSLSNWFKGKSNGTAEAPVENKATAAPAAPAAKPKAAAPTAPPVTRNLPAVRKVVPNSVQPVSLRDPSARPPMSLGVSAPAGPGASRPVTSLVPARKISFGNPAAVAAAHPSAPEFVAPPSAPQPETVPSDVPDVVVTLEVGDFIDRLPPTLLAGGAVDRSRAVEFRSSELYSDLTKGRASVPASVIYAKCPELFSRPVSETEDAEVALPLAKLVEQLTPALQTRADQVAEDNVGEIETPFLQVAMEDSARLPTAAGTTAGAIRPLTPLPPAPASVELPPRPLHRTGQIQTISAPKVPLSEPTPMPSAPTAQSVGPINPSKRPPSTVRASVAGGKIRLSGPTVPNRISLTPGPAIPPPPAVPFGVPALNNDLPPSATQRIATSMPPLPASAASPSHQVAKKTQRIQIPPISLRSPANPSASPVRPPAASPPSVPVQPSPVTVRPNNGETEPANPVVFRSSPPPPPSVKPMPQSFSPSPLRPGFPPPAFPAVPPPDVAPAPVAAPALAPVADDRKITLGLAAVLRGLSSSLLAVEASSVPDEVKISLPFALVEPQMRTGRVAVPRAVFVEALPEGHKEVLGAEADLTDVPLPLQEVFQNLPSNALHMRADQTEEQITHLYPTPFSQKAEEDAQRLGVGEVPVGASAMAPAAPADQPPAAEAPAVEEKPSAEISEPVAAEETPSEIARDIQLDLEDPAPAAFEEKPEEVVEAKTETPAPESTSSPLVEEAPAPVEPEVVPAAVMQPESAAATKVPVPAKGKDSELQVLFMTEDELDAKSIVRFVSQMPGINGCAVMFGDGLRLAGNFPDESQTEGFSAMAPPFFKRAKNFAVESALGKLQAFTLYTDNEPCSFLMHDDICLAVRHSNRGFMPGVREKLDIVVRELARMYSAAS